MNYIAIGIAGGSVFGAMIGMLVDDLSWLGAFIGAGAVIGTGLQVQKKKAVKVRSKNIK